VAKTLNDSKTLIVQRWNNLRKNLRCGDRRFEGARPSSRALHRFQDLRLGWEAVPLQNPDARAFFRKLSKRCSPTRPF